MNDRFPYMTMLALCAAATLAGCGGDELQPAPSQTRIIFTSNRALDGSDALNANRTSNIWSVTVDGASAVPLTRLTASTADSDTAVVSPDGTKVAYLSMRAFDGSDRPTRQPPPCLSPRLVCPPSLIIRNLWVSEIGGTDARPVTHYVDVQVASDPAWSPDGMRIAFASTAATNGSSGFGPNNIWVVNADGSGLAAVTTITTWKADSRGPSWSPDGSKLLYYSGRALDGSDGANWINPAGDPTTNIWVSSTDGTNARPLTFVTADKASSSDPTWSPSGQKVAYSSARALDGSDAAENYYTGNIWIMNADGTDHVPLTNLAGASLYSFQPGWSKDGRRIAFTSQRALDGSDARNGNDTINVWIVNSDGTGLAPLTKLAADGSSIYSAKWAPDNLRITYSSSRALDGSDANGPSPAAQNVWVMDSDGAHAQPVTSSTTVSSSDPQFVP